MRTDHLKDFWETGPMCSTIMATNVATCPECGETCPVCDDGLCLECRAVDCGHCDQPHQPEWLDSYGLCEACAEEIDRQCEDCECERSDDDIAQDDGLCEDCRQAQQEQTQQDAEDAARETVEGLLGQGNDRAILEALRAAGLI